MCYGMGCPFENPLTGECKGKIDWSKPDAACVCENDFEVKDNDDTDFYRYGFDPRDDTYEEIDSDVRCSW